LVAKLHNFDVKTQIHEQDKQIAYEKKALQQQMKNATVQDHSSPSNATKVVTFKGKTANETKQIALNQTNIDVKAREILANTKIHVNDTKVNLEAQNLNKRMEMANLEREKAEKLKADMDHIE
jgi:hypothetical protein